ncbi:restriction endonuclease subunit S [Mycoplasma sp. VS42A]|uniref:restriction endonuclease subunit S n=1 Tax=Mycoplasma sp. VS42A TaxID=3398774 RepID=UPI003A885736
MQKEKIVPAIRFKGFKEEWKEKKINQILIPIVSDLTMLCIQEKEPYPVYDANNIVGYSSYALSSVPYLTIIKDGAGVGRTRKLPANSSFLGTMTGLIPKNSDIDFTYNLMSSLKLEKNFSGSTIPHIYFSDYGKYLVYVPSIIEQQKIGLFLSNLDILITCVERNLDKLQTIKQSLLNKMFASFGQKMPQVRFKNFDKKWEVILISELLEERNELSKKTDDFPLMAFISKKGIVDKGDKYDRESLVSDVKNKPYKKTFYGDFIYSSNNLESGSIGMNRYGNALISPVYNIFRTKRDSNYINYLLCRKEVINNMVVWRQGVIYGQWRIHPSNFLSIQIASSLSEAEQQKIGQFLSNLDSLVHSQEQKLEKLNNIKQALLEKMFC